MYNPKADLRQYDRYIRRKRAALALALLMTLSLLPAGLLI